MEWAGKIIFNELASRRPVALPGVGTLWVEQSPARDREQGIVPPSNVVVYSTEVGDDAHSVAELMEAAGMAREDAEKEYARWLESARTDQGTDLGAAGWLEGGRFIPSAELAALLNPCGGDGSVIEPEARHKSAWILLIIILALLLAGGWYWWCGQEREDVPAATTPTPQPIEMPQTETPAPTPAPTNETASAAPAPEGGIKYYVVGGIFAWPENADRYIAGMKRDHPDLHYEKTAYYGKTLVSLFSTSDGKQAAEMRDSLAERTGNRELWIYKR